MVLVYDDGQTLKKMPVFLIIAAGMLFWLWRSGRLKSLSTKDLIALAVAVLGTKFLLTGQFPSGGAMLSGAGAWAFYRWLGQGNGGKAAPNGPRDDGNGATLADSNISVAEARKFLGVSETSDRADIILAHKRLIRKFHPDNGGDADLARQANIARDVLLQELDRLK